MLREMNRRLKSSVPRSLYRRIRFLADLSLSFEQPSYSWLGEDRLLADLFKNQNKGFYIDVGAFHPKQFSNTFLLYKRGWRGICIDAEPESIRLFRLLRPRDISIEAAVSDKDEVITFASWGINPENSGHGGQITGVQRDQGTPLKMTALKTQRLDDILNSHLPAGTNIDLLNIDVEGMDLQVLKSIDLARYSPRVVVIESFESTIEAILASEIYGHLKANGFHLMSWSKVTLFFGRSDKSAVCQNPDTP